MTYTALPGKGATPACGNGLRLTAALLGGLAAALVRASRIRSVGSLGSADRR